MPNELTDDNFENKVIKSPIISIVDFWAPWCGPCKMLTPVLEQVNDIIKDTGISDKIQIYKMNIDENPNIPSKHGVRAIPMMVMFKNGKVIDTKVGLQQKQTILDWINENIT